MTRYIGLICEDTSDYEVFENILSKYTPKNSYKIKKYISSGSGRLESKCHRWVENLLKDSCCIVFILRDSDGEIPSKIKSRINKKITHNANAIVVPITEIESWLLTNAKALKEVFNLQKVPKLSVNPETLKDPKARLSEIVYCHRTNKYLKYSNTKDNLKIVEKLSISDLSKCSSYKDLNDELVKLFPKNKSQNIKTKKKATRKK